MISKKRTFLCLLFLGMSLPLLAQWESRNNNIYNTNSGFVGIGTSTPAQELDVNGSIQAKKLELLDLNRGHSNGDRLRLYRDDPRSDYALLKLQLGDENQAEFQIGYVDWQTQEWVKSFSIHNNNTIQLGNNAGDSKMVGRIGNNRTFGFHINRWGGKYEWTIGSANGDLSMMYLERNINGRILFSVNGQVHAKQIRVNLDYAAPDYVFHKDYNLRPLSEVESFINQHHHLPEIPSGKTLETEGINVADMEMSLLKKVEELTLYMISVNKELDQLKKEKASLLHRIEQLENKK